jgi:hypothetical protein
VKLITAHRILIGAAIAACAFYAALRLRRYVGGASGGDLVQGLVAAAVAAGLVVYYRTLKDWGRPR